MKHYMHLRQHGSQRKFLNMIKYIYRNSEISILAGGKTTCHFGMLRGTRQGCPLSPLLFIIFVNSLLRESTAGGVDVPGTGKRCQGAQYADDVVVLEETKENAQSFCQRIYEWGQEWGIELGLKKCGVILFSDKKNEQDMHKKTVYSCTDGVLPTVEEYKYLGITVNPTLPDNRNADSNESQYVKQQAKKGEVTLNTLRPLLYNPTFPLSIKTTIIHTILDPVMTYGAEWLGYKNLNAAPLQWVQTKALKLAMGYSSRTNVFDPFTLNYELGIPTIAEQMNALCAHLSAKMAEPNKCKTWLKILHDNPYRACRKTWISTN